MTMLTEKEQRKQKEIYLQRLKNVTQNHSRPLIENIKSAFAKVLYPGHENLISTPEHRAECEECEGLYNYFVGKTWEETLEHKSIGWLSHAQSFFLPLAWQYYLPAYLIYCIRDKRFEGEFNLLPRENEELIDFQESRVELLTSWQCDSIIEYLEIASELWVGINDQIEAANLKYLKYWKENYRKAIAKEQNLK